VSLSIDRPLSSLTSSRHSSYDNVLGTDSGEATELVIDCLCALGETVSGLSWIEVRDPKWSMILRVSKPNSIWSRDVIENTMASPGFLTNWKKGLASIPVILVSVATELKGNKVFFNIYPTKKAAKPRIFSIVKINLFFQFSSTNSLAYF
jgi:hypothetical protein